VVAQLRNYATCGSESPTLRSSSARSFWVRLSRIESPTPNPLTQRVDGRGADFNENSFPLGRVTPVEDFQHLATVASTDVSEHIL